MGLSKAGIIRFAVSFLASVAIHFLIISRLMIISSDENTIIPIPRGALETSVKVKISKKAVKNNIGEIIESGKKKLSAATESRIESADLNGELGEREKTLKMSYEDFLSRSIHSLDKHSVRLGTYPNKSLARNSPP